MKRRVNLTVIFACVLLCLIAAVILVGLSIPEKLETIQGEVEMTDYRISSKVPGRVKEIRVEEGDRVKKGDTLIVLEAPDVMAKLNQANAALEAAEAIEQKAKKGARQEQIQGAYEMWQKAKAGLEVAQKTYERVAGLYADSVVSAQKMDEVTAQLNAMKATERAAKSQYDMAVNGAQKEDIEAAKAQVNRAKGAVSEVSSYIDETRLTALEDGEVTEIFPELGELVGTGSPLMNVAMTEKVWFTFNVREDLLKGLTVGAEVEAYMPATDKEIKVRISKIKDVGTYAIWKATKALDKYDLKTFEVKAVPVDMADVKDVREGMTVILKK
ncbi:MAG: efflux RND transporter periplasmic adaptor subunit [Bacteroidales bacterium]|nr:efflux RND transporter periplasmic adaptor subunit [Bacteroidales bacterium]